MCQELNDLIEHYGTQGTEEPKVPNDVTNFMIEVCTKLFVSLEEQHQLRPE